MFGQGGSVFDSLRNGGLSRFQIGSGNGDTGDPYGGPYGLFFRMLTDASNAGIFSPDGSPGLMDSIRRRGIADAGALERGSVLRAQASGVSPESVNFARLMGGMQGQGMLADRMGQADQSQREGFQDFIRQLLATRYGTQWQPRPERERRGGSISLGPVGIGF